MTDVFPTMLCIMKECIHASAGHTSVEKAVEDQCSSPVPLIKKMETDP